MWPPCCYCGLHSSSAVDQRQSGRVPLGRHPRCTNTSGTTSTHTHDALTTICPTFAIVDIGTNDISNGAPTVTVADAVVQLAHEIIDVFGARHVTVCSALHRSSPLDINNLIDNYNNILRNFCDVEPLIDYHTHRGFWNTDTYTWSRDGLHPNTNVGRAKYKRSLRKAVNHALSVVHKPKWYSILSLLTECTALHRILFPAGVRPLLHIYTITSNLHHSANIKHFPPTYFIEFTH